MKPIIVTGYTAIPGHPRTTDEYERLNDKLRQVTAAPVKVHRTDLTELWMQPFIQVRQEMAAAGFAPRVIHAVGDNPQKNTLAYHMVQHQKTAWLLMASEQDPTATVLVWIDYGIFHQPGITVDVINAFIERLAAIERLDDIWIPGAWDGSSDPLDSPNWHFCGSSLIVPRQHVQLFHDQVKEVTLNRLARGHLVTWEINDWAQVEAQRRAPIRWYRGDHNQTQFTNFNEALLHAAR
jgi:hypothetical protein